MSEVKPKFYWIGCWQSDPNVKPLTRQLLGTLSYHMDEHGESCFPTIDQIEYESGMARATVVKHLKLAYDAGWIAKRSNQFKGQKWKNNSYKAVVPEGAKNIPWKKTEAYKSKKMASNDDGWQSSDAKKGSSNCEEAGSICEEGSSNCEERQFKLCNKAVQSVASSIPSSSQLEKESQTADAESSPPPASPKKQITNKRILPGAMTECDGECHFDYPSTHCPDCKKKIKLAKAFASKMLNNHAKYPEWRSVFRTQKERSLAKGWFETGFNHKSAEVAKKLDEMVLAGEFAKETKSEMMWFGTAIERAARTLEIETA